MEYNREPKIEPHKYSQVIFNIGPKVKRKEKVVFLTNGPGKSEIHIL